MKLFQHTLALIASLTALSPSVVAQESLERFDETHAPPALQCWM